MMKFFRKNKDSQNYLTKAMIGLGYGLVKTRGILLNDSIGISSQDAMDALSVWVGRELVKELLDQQRVRVTDSDEIIIGEIMNIINLAEELHVNGENDTIKIVVQKCQICPKRIGGYDLEGQTACPVGGLVTGALSYAHNSNPVISKNHLQTGEICHIDIKVQTS